MSLQKNLAAESHPGGKIYEKGINRTRTILWKTEQELEDYKFSKEKGEIGNQDELCLM
jgi:hypothetical protein